MLQPVKAFITWQRSLEVNPSFRSGSFFPRDFAIRAVSMETVISRVFFCIVFERMARVPYNKLLSNLAR